MQALTVICIIGFVLLCGEAVYALEPISLYSKAESFTYSEVMSIDGFINDFSGDLESGSTAVTHNVLELGFSYGDWQVARVIRYDYVNSFSEDTAFLNYQLENGVVIDETRPYHIALKVDHLRSSGIKLGRSVRIRDNLTVRAAISWLESEQFYSGHIIADINQGDFDAQAVEDLEALVSSIESGDINTFDQAGELGKELRQSTHQLQEMVVTTDLKFDANYHYYKPALREDEIDDFSDVDLFSPSGAGLVLDLGLSWEINEKWSMNFEMLDFYSYIKWDNAPATTANAQVTRAALDTLDVLEQFVEEDIIKRANGSFFTSINPSNPDDPEAVVPEIESQIQADNSTTDVRNEKYIQHLPKRYKLLGHYQMLPNIQLSGEIYKTRVQTFSSVYIDFFQSISLAYQFEAEAMGLEFYNRYFKLSLIVDEADIKQAQFISLYFGLHVFF